jgi:hypothetical protein
MRVAQLALLVQKQGLLLVDLEFPPQQQHDILRLGAILAADAQQPHHIFPLSIGTQQDDCMRVLAEIVQYDCVSNAVFEELGGLVLFELR